MNIKPLMRRTVFHIIRTRQFNDKCIKQFAKTIHNKKILELGSGKRIRGKCKYSSKKFFDKSNKFICSDINKKFGHNVIDATKMKLNKEFDVVLCLSVLEHIFDFEKAVKNIYNALKTSGMAVIFVPGFYPLHEEPNDYWRFTEHSLKKILKDFKKVNIRTFGIRQYPFGYYIEARR
jgi:SAM-dependent methyltransferase